MINERELLIKVDNVSMMFNLSKERVDNIKEYVIKLIKHELLFKEFWALKNISLKVYRGESLGLIGLNGSGKSTLLKIIAGVMKPTTGSIQVTGSIAPLIELGAGFDMDLSAKENIFLNGSMLGFTEKQMKNKYKDILDFSELWDFEDVAIKNFSSGMLARLGFSIATTTQPDILIVDEILSVGDYKFQEKCEEKINQMLDNGTTIVMVSHSVSQIKRICKKALWIDHGNFKEYGDANIICDHYMNMQKN